MTRVMNMVTSEHLTLRINVGSCGLLSLLSSTIICNYYCTCSIMIQEEIKRLSSCNAYYHSVQSLLLSHLLSSNLKIRIYKNIILPVALYGCETWSLILREEHRLRVFENRVR
jgi:hypothetical protein